MHTRLRRTSSRLVWTAVALCILSSSLLAEPISQAHLHTLDTELCAPVMQGRATGSDGGREAQRYIAREFQRLHLSMLGTDAMDDLKAQLDGSGYFQPYGFFDHFTEASRSKLDYRIGKIIRRLRWLRDYRADTLSSSASLTGDTVFVKYGYVSTEGSYDDYRGKDVSGKIVIVLDGVPDVGNLDSRRNTLPSKIVQAASRKAKAMLYVVDDSIDLHAQLSGDQITMSLPVIRVKRSVIRPLIYTLNEGTSVVASIDVQLKSVFTGASNVMGWLDGTDPAFAERPLLVSSHVDHLGNANSVLMPGADDNASGTGVMLSLASALKDHPLRRPVLFIAFTGEEKGLLGSNAFIKQPAWPLEQIDAVIDLDMVGRLRDDKLWAMCVGSSPVWSDMLDEVNKKALIPFDITKEDWYSGVSDFAPFVTAGVPTLFLFTGLHPDYHQPTDTVDRLNIWGQKRVTLFAEQILRKLDASDEKPLFVVKSGK